MVAQIVNQVALSVFAPIYQPCVSRMELLDDNYFTNAIFLT